MPSTPDSLQVPALKQLLLTMREERTVERLLHRVVDELRAQPAVALARLWLLKPGDLCNRCRLATQCAERSTCLHLVASAGEPLQPGENWDRIDGHFRRFPIGVLKVGHVAATRESVEVADIDSGSDWIADPEWARRESIRGFVGQPLLHQDQLLGVLGVFLRVPVATDESFWLRMIADHAASAIAHAHAFEEIDRLRNQLELENEYLRAEVQAAHPFGEMIGGDAIARVLEQVELVAPTDSNVLILGESGVGKELVARAIHDRSARGDRVLIRVNCASIPQELFESEFFGHLAGAFTGAIRDRAGRFELADGGTLFLDEVGEIPLAMQGKLLRVLQEGTYERIGDEETRQADVRIVAATNRALEDDVKAGRFRKDLYYRLSVFPIEVPPLRDRPEDIPELAVHFLDLQSRRLGSPLSPLRKRHVQQLVSYDWPGNVRELQNVIERAAIRSRGGALELDLPDGKTSPLPTTADSESGVQLRTDLELRQLERDNMIAVLEAHAWKVAGPGGAAEFLGLHPATLASRVRSLGIRRPR